MKISTPDELVSFLVELFPEFEKEWQDELEGHEDSANYIGYRVDITFHQVIQTFAPYGSKFLETLQPKQLGRFCKFINEAVESGGDLENALSTCLLEHASQLEIIKILKPKLTGAARNELR